MQYLGNFSANEFKKIDSSAFSEDFLFFPLEKKKTDQRGEKRNSDPQKNVVEVKLSKIDAPWQFSVFFSCKMVGCNEAIETVIEEPFSWRQKGLFPPYYFSLSAFLQRERDR